MKFKVGDLVEGVGFQRNKQYNGMFGEIVQITPGRRCFPLGTNIETTADCLVEWADGHVYFADFINLRKRPERGIPKEVREIFEQPINVGMVTT
jgi:hypothetical protein